MGLFGRRQPAARLEGRIARIGAASAFVDRLTHVMTLKDDATAYRVREGDHRVFDMTAVALTRPGDRVVLMIGVANRVEGFLNMETGLSCGSVPLAADASS